jgi:hypothetical protein
MLFAVNGVVVDPIGNRHTAHRGKGLLQLSHLVPISPVTDVADCLEPFESLMLLPRIVYVSNAVIKGFLPTLPSCNDYTADKSVWALEGLQ